MDPSGYPLIYCPPGVQRPSHCPHLGAVGIKAPASGPDGKAGQTYGGPYLPAQRPMWSETKHGWWVKLAGYQPQHLIRMDVSPRIVRFHLVEGADKDQWWQVPVLLRPVDDKHHNRGFMSALDRVLGPNGFTAPPELEELQCYLLAVARGIRLEKNQQKRNAKFADLVLRILQQTHHVSDGEMIAAGWLSVSMMVRVVLAATDRPEAYQREGIARARA